LTTASAVPPTRGELEGDEALDTLRRTGRKRLALDAAVRFRAADGFSHSRALAFQFTLTLIPYLIAIVGFARAAGEPEVSEIVATTLRDLAPGPAGEVLTSTIEQGEEEAGETALVLGALAALIAGATAMGQIERGANRIYGVERDRPALRKYGVATLLACSAGIATFLALVLVVAGGELGDAITEVTGWRESLDTAWEVGRWPLGAVLVGLSVTLIFKVSPRRPQPALSWLALGAGLALTLWIAFTAALAAYLTLSKDFGETYGPLAGLIGLLLWTLLTALALFAGLALAAQLEAVRAGVPAPADDVLDQLEARS
jgi:YihY family inner membrane protein